MRLLFPCVFGVLVYASASAEGEVNRWAPIGPWGAGGSIMALAIDPVSPSTLYAGTSVGVFKSMDRGQTWTHFDRGIPSAPVFALAIDPKTPTTLYAGMATGLYKTTDGGESWSLAYKVPSSQQISAVAIDPRITSNVYVGLKYLGGGVVKTTDGGTTWAPINDGLLTFSGQLASVDSFAIDPAEPSTVYAACNGDPGIVKTTTGGTAWSWSYIGLAFPTAKSIVISPAAPKVLYVLSSGIPARTNDGGRTWTMLNPTTPNPANGPVPLFTALAVDPIVPTRLYAGSLSKGVLVSSDGGTVWSPTIGSAAISNVAALVADPLRSSTIYVVGDGLAQSEDSGSTWTRRDVSLLGLSVGTIAVDPASPGTVYLATRDESYLVGLPAAGVFRTDDRGTTWTAINNGLSNFNVTAFGIGVGFPSVLYVGTNGSGVFRSFDGGASWTAANAGLTVLQITALAVDPRVPATVYATIPGAIFKSVDGAQSWAKLSVAPLPVAEFVHPIVVDPTSSSTVYAGTGSGLLKSTDAGATWTSVFQQTFSGVGAIAVDPQRPSTVYAGTYYTGPSPGGIPSFGAVYKSTNGGQDWALANIGLGMGSPLSLAIDPATPSTVWTATIRYNRAGGVYRSKDGGVSWLEMNGGLPDSETGVLAIDPSSTSTVYLGSFATAAFKMTVAGPGEACSGGPTSLCLAAGRFQLRASWRAPTAQPSVGQGVSLTSNTGAFWFFDPTNLELAVKVLDGRSINGKFWVFYGALTNVEFTLTVTDTLTGAVKTYFNPQGQLASVADTSAF